MQAFRSNMTYVFSGDSKPPLDQSELCRRLLMFNLTNDWSWFDDVPESQHINVMYPHVISAYGVTKMERVEGLLDLFGKNMTDSEKRDIRDRYA